MQELNFRIREAFQNGIRREPTPTANVAYLERCMNLVPREGGLATVPTFARPGDLEAQPKNFPYPQIFKGDSIRVSLGETTVRTLNSLFGASANVSLNLRAGGTGAIAQGTAWQFESFLDMWFASNGSSMVYKIPSDNGDTFISDSFLAQAIGRHDYRVLFGGLSGDWLAGARWLEFFTAWRETHTAQSVVHDTLAAGTSWVIFGESGGGAVDAPFYALACACGLYGNTGFDTAKEIIWDSLERGDIGLIPVRKVSNIRALKQLGNRMIVYGDDAISEIQQIDGGFQETLVADFGIGGRCCVGGDDRRHVFFNGQGQLYSWFANQDRPERQGYAAIFSQYLPERTVITYDPVEGYFWISDGGLTYVLTRTGLGGPMSQHPTSMFRDSQYGLVGMYSTALLDSWEIQTTNFDMGHRDFKHFVLAQVIGDGYRRTTGRVSGTTDVSGVTRNTPWVQSNKDGVVFPRMSFIEGSVTLRGVGDDVNLSAMEIRYQNEGRKYRRGTSGAPDGD